MINWLILIFIRLPIITLSLTVYPLDGLILIR